MKRVLPLLLVAAFVLSCQDNQPAPTSPTLGAPQTAISDGANGGNQHFYWLPELVESPTYTGTFNPDLPATINLCELDVVSGPDPFCMETPTVLFGPADVTVSIENEQYSAVWHTGDDTLTSGDFYRLSVSIGARELGYRDLNPLANPPSPIDKAAPFYAFKNENTINIKFRIEDGVLCEGDGPCGECFLETTGGGGNNPDFFPTDPDVRACNADPGLGVQIPDGVLPEPVVVIVERVACGTTESDGRVNFFTHLDIPQYGGCFTARTEPELTQPISFATVAVCVDTNGLSTTQEERLLLHQTADRNDPSAEIRALNNVAADFVDCEAFAAAQTPALLRWASRGWHAVNPFSAAPAYATHQGKGGDIISFSDFVWALPSQQEILEGDDQTALVGTAVAVPPAVLVTDQAGDPVAGARVTFTVTEDQNGGLVVADVPTVTGSDGIARVTSWTLGNDIGINVLAASGFGIGVKGDTWTQSDGRAGIGPFTHAALTTVPSGLEGFPLPVQEPSLEFTAFGCVQGVGSATPDGMMGAGEYDCAESEAFTANLSGGQWPATIYWMTSPAQDMLYMAVKIERDGSAKANILTVVLDDDNDGRSLNDDVLNIDGQLAGAQQFTDQYLGTNCKGKGQDFCASLDDVQDGDGRFAVNNVNGQTFWLYEIAKPLSNDAFGQDVNQSKLLVSGLRFYLSLRYGSGNQGNTEWPDFAVYQSIIAPTAP
jgi:hypothetical protein